MNLTDHVRDMLLISNHAEKLLLPAAGNRDRGVVAHHHMSTFTAHIHGYLSEVDDMGIVDPEKIPGDQSVFKITEWSRDHDTLSMFQGKYSINAISPGMDNFVGIHKYNTLGGRQWEPVKQ